jgi:OOP family OmpA-OmpF porin
MIMMYLLKRTVTLFVALFLLQGISAQQTPSNNIVPQPFKGAKQFRKFSFGLNAGVLSPSVVIGGTNDFTNPESSFGYGANVRYQITHYLALQADVLRGNLKANQDKNISDGGPPVLRPVKSFKTDLHWAATLSGQVTFGNVNWLSVKNTVVPYVSGGLGYASYSPVIVRTGTTVEEAYDGGGDIEELIVPVAVGIKVNLTRLINLDFGYRMHFVDGDNLDGSPYWFNPAGSPLKKDKFSYGFAGLEFSLGNQRKPRLVFDNPAFRTNDILQSQITNNSSRIDSLAAAQKSLTDDTDGDGVPDRFDREPNTPAGSPVDARGMALDTDGDGVPDSRDKQLVTPTECQPVDADGVGKCPEPDCCKNLTDSTAMECMADYPSVNFSGNSVQLSNTSRGIISTLATQLKEKPNCKIILRGYPAASKSSQSVCQRRLDAIKNRLVETEGISADRISTDCSVEGGDKNTVDVSSN